MNYYDLLGISPNATSAQIREAYRRLAKQYHPDRFHRLSETGKKYAEEKMLLLNEAYRVLSDAEERANYEEEIRVKTSKVPSVSSEAYARYVDLDWRLTQLLGQKNIRKSELESINHTQTISLAWVRATGVPFFLVVDFAHQAVFTFDMLMMLLLVMMGTSVKRFNWRSRTSISFWISLGCLWGWIFFILPVFPFSSNSDLRHGIPFLLFLISQALLFRLHYLVEKENKAQRLQEQTALQQEMLQIMLELKKLETELFGSEKPPNPQTRYN